RFEGGRERVAISANATGGLEGTWDADTDIPSGKTRRFDVAFSANRSRPQNDPGHNHQSLSRLRLEWGDRRLLARIHRYTLNRLRAEIEPISPADFMRFLFVWQHVHPSARLAGLDGLRAAIASLDGFELAASAWERSVLPARMDRYDPSLLDT